MSFEDNQQRYYTQEINRELPLSKTSVSWSALGLPDLTPASSTSSALQRDAACRAISKPGPGMRAPDARVGCGWWYSPSGTSVGAYGTRRGPMNPTLDTQVGAGQWIWDPQEAYRLEGQKASGKIKSCQDLSLSPFPNIGWCTSTNSAVLTDGAGHPAFPQQPGGDCPSGSIVMTADQCPTQSQNQGQGQPSVSSLCTPDATGALSPACIQSLIANGGTCSASGTLAQALSSGGYAGTSQQFNQANAILEQRGFSIHPGIINDGRVTTDQVISTLTGLRAFGTSEATGSRAQNAALNLCYGTPYNPCLLEATDSGPYDPSCIAQTAMGLGFGAKGKLLPGNSSMDYWNSLPTWGDVVATLTGWKQTADAGGSNTQKQVTAINNVYGLTVKPPNLGCNTAGLFMYRYYLPQATDSLFPVAGAQTHFLGRYLLKDGFPEQGAITTQDMTPAGGPQPEGQRMCAQFTPTQTGSYQFLMLADNYARLQLPSGTVIAEVPVYNKTLTPSQVIQLSAGQSYPLVADIWNANPSGGWVFSLHMSVNGSEWTPIPVGTLTMPTDRRLPTIELAFNKMPAGTVGPTRITDTAKVIQNWQMNSGASIGSLNGRNCLVITGPGASVTNSARFVQGVRLRGLRSITMMLCVNSTNIPSGAPRPTFLSFYNLPTSNPTGFPSLGPTAQPYKYMDRTTDFSFVGNVGAIYPFGLQPGIGYSSFMPTRQSGVLPQGQWTHIAYVWDEDGAGSVMYVNGVQGPHASITPYDIKQMLEFLTIGCDYHPEGQSWTGGIAWFRAFDYRLSPEQVGMDMSDNWASLTTSS